MMKRILLSVAVMGIGLANVPAQAADLVQVYQDALKHDQQYLQAEAQYLTDKEILAAARSAVLPDLEVTGNAGQTWAQRDVTEGKRFGAVVGKADTGTFAYGYNLQLTQTIFNWGAFAALRAAKSSVKQAAATFADAKQALVLRVAQNYFNVLEAKEVLRTSAANQASLKSQLNVASQRYKVGLDAITRKYQAQAAYDSAHAQYIKDENAVAVNKENLRVITGKLYDSLAPLEHIFPLVKPQPANINTWEKVAVENNLGLKAARFSATAANESIGAFSGQRSPTINAVGSFGQQWQRANNDSSPISSASLGGAARDTTAKVGVQLDFPVFQGGKISSDVRKAEASYKLAVATMDLTYRQTVAQTRQSYLSIISGISQLRADQRAIISAQASVKATRAGYKVGTETIIDVLNQQQNLFSAETTYTADRFDYLNNTLQLKQQTGSLTGKDLAEINRWMVTVNKPATTARSAAPTTMKRPAKTTK